MSDFDKMKSDDLERNFHRLNWAAATSDDPLWSKEHRRQAAYIASLLAAQGIEVVGLK